MNKLIICCVFGLLVALQLVAGDGSVSISEFKRSIDESVNDQKLTCENFKNYCKQDNSKDGKAIQAYCELVLNGYLCQNLKDGAGLQKLYNQSMDYLYQQSRKIVNH